MRARAAALPATRISPTSASPALGLSRPASRRSSVVFPAPFGPNTASASPSLKREAHAIDRALAPEHPVEVSRFEDRGHLASRK